MKSVTKSLIYGLLFFIIAQVMSFFWFSEPVDASLSPILDYIELIPSYLFFSWPVYLASFFIIQKKYSESRGFSWKGPFFDSLKLLVIIVAVFLLLIGFDVLLAVVASGNFLPSAIFIFLCGFIPFNLCEAPLGLYFIPLFFLWLNFIPLIVFFIYVNILYYLDNKFFKK